MQINFIVIENTLQIFWYSTHVSKIERNVSQLFHYFIFIYDGILNEIISFSEVFLLSSSLLLSLFYYEILLFISSRGGGEGGRE